MEREERVRAVDALLALSRADRDVQDEALEVLRARLAQVRPVRDRAVVSHGVVGFGLRVVGVAAESRYLAAAALRASARAAGRPNEWSYAALGRLWGVSRAMAQTVMRRPRGAPKG